jgi:hypothetical protein
MTAFDLIGTGFQGVGRLGPTLHPSEGGAILIPSPSRGRGRKRSDKFLLKHFQPDSRGLDPAMTEEEGSR